MPSKLLLLICGAWTACAPSAVAQVDTICNAGPERLAADVQAYYGCVQRSVLEMEPSGEGGQVVADAAVSACSMTLIDVQLEALNCDANITAANGGSVAYKVHENSISKIETNAHGYALVTVLRLRAARRTASPAPR